MHPCLHFKEARKSMGTCNVNNGYLCFIMTVFIVYPLLMYIYINLKLNLGQKIKHEQNIY